MLHPKPGDAPASPLWMFWTGIRRVRVKGRVGYHLRDPLPPPIQEERRRGGGSRRPVKLQPKAVARRRSGRLPAPDASNKGGPGRCPCGFDCVAGLASTGRDLDEKARSARGFKGTRADSGAMCGVGGVTGLQEPPQLAPCVSWPQTLPKRWARELSSLLQQTNPGDSRGHQLSHSPIPAPK